VAFDIELFRLINDLAGRVPVLDILMRLVVNEYFIPTTISLVLLVMWFDGVTVAERVPNQRAVIYAIITLLFANLLVKLCNLVYFRPRPFASCDVNLLFYRPTDSSFPSNPAAVGFAFATAVWLRNRRVGGYLYILAALFAFSRVYCGVHYPLDVGAGALIGGFCGLLVRRYERLLEPLVRFVIVAGRRLFLA